MDIVEPEMSETAEDAPLPEKQYRVCKISIVNQNGQIVLDTLVDYKNKAVKAQVVNTAALTKQAQIDFSDGESDKEN